MTPKQRTSFGYAIISVALVLLLLGLIGLLYIQTNSLVNYFKENVSVLVEIKPESSENQIDILKKSIEISPFVKLGSMSYTSKERGAYLLSKEFGKDLSTFGFENPLYNIIQFKLKAGYEVSDSISRTKKVLAGNPLIHDVYVQEGMISNINDYLKKGILVAIGFAVIFMLIAVALIYNTIRLALNSNAMLIKNMQLVGATRGYIKRPFLWKAMMNGVIASMLAISMLLGLLLFIHYQLPEIAYLENTMSLLWLFFGLMILGILLNLLSTEMVLRKYLNMRIDEVY